MLKTYNTPLNAFSDIQNQVNKKWKKSCKQCPSMTDKGNSDFTCAENQSHQREELKVPITEGNVSFKTREAWFSHLPLRALSEAES